MSYKLQSSKEQYEIFRVYFDAFVDNENKNLDSKYKSAMVLSPQTVGPHNVSIQPQPNIEIKGNLGYPPKKGPIHVGWPCRMDPIEERFQKFLVDYELQGKVEQEYFDKLKQRRLRMATRVSFSGFDLTSESSDEDKPRGSSLEVTQSSPIKKQSTLSLSPKRRISKLNLLKKELSNRFANAKAKADKEAERIMKLVEK